MMIPPDGHPEAPVDLICGIDRNLVERFLLLLRDNYARADEATYYLEKVEGVSNIAGIANMRDAVSHFVSALDASTPDDRREEQIHAAEEHLRRAILEPYERALNKRVVEFNKLYGRYAAMVIPIMCQYPLLANAPNQVRIEAVLERVTELSIAGRNAKRRNLWDAEWERGVVGLVNAHKEIRDLYKEVETYWHSYRQINREAELDQLQQKQEELQRKQKILAIWGVVATVVAAVLTVLLAL